MATSEPDFIVQAESLNLKRYAFLVREDDENGLTTVGLSRPYTHFRRRDL